MILASKKPLLINSLLIVISTTVIGLLLHECSHFLMAKYFDLKPVFHNTYVSYDSTNVTEAQSAIVAGVGPLFSLISGMLFLFISIKYIRPSIPKLFFLWLGMNGLLMFLGYVLIAPFVKNGDTGKVFDYFGFPIYVSVLLAVLCFVIILKFLKSISSEFTFYKQNGIFDKHENSKQLFVYPVIGSILVMTILSLPVQHWISLLPTVFLPLAYLSVMKSYRKTNISNPEFNVGKISNALLLVTLGLIVLFVSLRLV